MITAIDPAEMPQSKRFKKMPLGGIMIRGKYYIQLSYVTGRPLYRIDTKEEYNLFLDIQGKELDEFITLHNRKQILETL
jgi:hypothetical protein